MNMKLEEIKCAYYCEHHCGNFIILVSDPHKGEL